jgi:hypothetical protein
MTRPPTEAGLFFLDALSTRQQTSAPIQTIEVYP